MSYLNMFIPPIADIVEEYMRPDYKAMYDCVIRDLNWIGPEIMSDLYIKMCLCDENINFDDLYTEKGWSEMFNKGYSEEFDAVIRALMLKNNTYPTFLESRNRFCRWISW